MEIKINKSNNSSSKTNNINNITNDNGSNSFSFYEYIDITVGDPISSLLLTDKYAIIGTMMGAIKVFCLNSDINQFFVLCKENKENIVGLSYIEKYNRLYASMGDEKILFFDFNSLHDNLIPDSLEIYEDKYFHNVQCDNTYIMMSTNNILKINIFNQETEETIKIDSSINYEVIYFSDDDINNIQKKKGNIKSSNYYVPLDFDGVNFCWVEYLNDQKDRNLCIQFILKDGTIDNVDYKFHVDKYYGHISHAKLLNEGKILIVHELNKCEIRNISSKFELLENFTHIGDEVYAIDLIYNERDTFISENLGNNNNKKNVKRNSKNFHESYTNNENIYKAIDEEKINNESKGLKGRKKLPKLDNRNKKYRIGNSNEIKTDTLKLLKNQTKKSKLNELNQNLIILTLDIDGNVNKYENQIEEKLFNIYNIKGIPQDHKDKKFFYMGYVYFIKSNLNYYCITTDHGCYIFKRNEE